MDLIDSLENKLDQISQNIQEQYDVEEDHAESKSKVLLYNNSLVLVLDNAKSQHKWATFIKNLIIIAICGAQVYFVASFFSKGGKRRNEMNPFQN